MSSYSSFLSSSKPTKPTIKTTSMSEHVISPLQHYNFLLEDLESTVRNLRLYHTQVTKSGNSQVRIHDEMYYLTTLTDRIQNIVSQFPTT